MSDQLIDQAREHIARVWAEQGWRSERTLDGTGWDVWTLDATGQRRIIIARGCTPNVAGLLCFVSTALPQLCDRASATPSPWRPAVNAASNALGAWMSAALDDPAVCDAMKADIRAWFDAGQPVASPWRPDREAVARIIASIFGFSAFSSYVSGATDAILALPSPKAALSQPPSGGAELEALKVAAVALSVAHRADAKGSHAAYVRADAQLTRSARAYAASVEQGEGE